MGDAVRAQTRELLARVGRLIVAGRRDGSIAPSPPAAVLAKALMSAVEGVVIALAGRIGDDEQLARRVALGLLSPARTD